MRGRAKRRRGQRGEGVLIKVGCMRPTLHHHHYNRKGPRRTEHGRSSGPEPSAGRWRGATWREKGLYIIGSYGVSHHRTGSFTPRCTKHLFIEMRRILVLTYYLPLDTSILSGRCTQAVWLCRYTTSCTGYQKYRWALYLSIGQSSRWMSTRVNKSGHAID